MNHPNVNPKQMMRAEEFVSKHFPNATLRDTHGGREWRDVCPFCHGGRTREESFDMNTSTLVARCWRASCGFAGTFGWFIHKYLEVPYPRAVEILGGEEESSLENLSLDLQLLNKHIEQRRGALHGHTDASRISAWVEGSISIKNAPETLVQPHRAWIETVRGYDWEEFNKIHDLFIPPQYGAYKNRILFSVTCKDDRGYLLYAIEPDIYPKTLNPSGRVLSSMIYQFDRIKNAPVIFICEGIFDAARLLSYGFAATCTFSTNISKAQIQLLSETSAKEICVTYDAGAGDKAKRVARELGEYISDKTISYIRMEPELFTIDEWKDGIDPDEISEEQFTRLFLTRAKLVNREEDALLRNLNRLTKNLRK